jgi:hypothetical protein
MSDEMVSAAAQTVPCDHEPDSDAWIGIALLRAELAHDLKFITLNYRKNREMTHRIDAGGGADEFDYAALGYTQHNLYKTPLIPEKLLYANRQAAGVDDLMAKRHAAFDQFLTSLARRLDDD